MSRSPTIKVCLFLVSLLVFYLVPEPSGAFVVQVNGDRITVNAEKTPLQEILLKLSDSGIRVQIDPQINPPVTASFDKREVRRT